jgi:hypothetical protein
VRILSITVLTLFISTASVHAQGQEIAVEIAKIVGKKLIEIGVEAGVQYGIDQLFGKDTPPDQRVNELQSRLGAYEAALKQVDAKQAVQIAALRKELNTKTTAEDVRKVVESTLKSLEDRTVKLEYRQDLLDSRVRQLEEVFGYIPTITPAPLLTSASKESGKPTAHPLMAEWITLLMKSEESRLKLAELRQTRPDTAKAVQDAIATDKKILDESEALRLKVLQELADKLPKRQQLIAEYKPGTIEVRKFDESLASVTWLAAVTRMMPQKSGEARMMVPKALFGYEATEILRAFEIAKVDRKLIVDLHRRYALSEATRSVRICTLSKDQSLTGKPQELCEALAGLIESGIQLPKKAKTVDIKLKKMLAEYADDSPQVLAVRDEQTNCLKESRELQSKFDDLLSQLCEAYLEGLKTKRPTHKAMTLLKDHGLTVAATWANLLRHQNDRDADWPQLTRLNALLLDSTGKDGADAETVRAAQVLWASLLGEKSHLIAFWLTSDGKVTVDMCLLPPGKYSRGEVDKQTIITITQPLWVSRYEVTQKQYAAVMGNNPSRLKKEGDDASLYPVEMVTHDDCVKFTQKASVETGAEFRLLREAEWEYAYRAGTRTRFYNGDSDDKLGDIAQYKKNNDKNPEKVGSKLPNAFGLYDMAGNVWEWCSDWYADNYDGTTTDPRGPSSGSDRVYRGGSWFHSAGNCGAAYRNWRTPDDNSRFLGFRLARVPSGSK